MIFIIGSHSLLLLFVIVFNLVILYRQTILIEKSIIYKIVLEIDIVKILETAISQISTYNWY